MLHQHRFYVSLLLGGERTGENWLLRSVDARERACGAWTPARVAPAERGRPEEPFWWIFGAPKGR
jgi:hypothetical protein